jgi:hypothetical protein
VGGDCDRADGCAGTCQPIRTTDFATCNASIDPFVLQWGSPDAGTNCDQTQYNDMATVLLSPHQNIIISIMEDPRGQYSSLTLLCAGLVVYWLSGLTYGAAIPAGVFVPIIYIGACFGSLFGIEMERFFEMHFADCAAGTWCYELQITAAPYTLQGAVALLGGVQRSSLSLVVIILEGTGAVKQLLPIILTTVVAKWVGDVFNLGLYQTALDIKRIPFLAPAEHRQARLLAARDVMSPAINLVCFEQTEPAGTCSPRPPFLWDTQR